MSRKSKTSPLKASDLVCTNIVRSVMPYLDRFVPASRAVHGNTLLHLGDVLVVMLSAFFNPTCRSLRLIEELSQIDWVNKKLSVEQVCKSTLSDAFARFEPEQLAPLIQGLMDQIPNLSGRDRDLQGVCKQVIAADGSFFLLAADVTWALHQAKTGGGKRGGGTHSRCRLDLQIDVDLFSPVDLSVGGREEGSEAAAFIPRLKSGVIYLIDRNFVHFGFLSHILAKDSDFVLRAKEASPRFIAQTSRPLCQRDLAAGVVSDRLGVLPGSRNSRTGPAPGRTLREVVIRGADGQCLRLLTSLLDAPAWVIGELYRRRWQIELFLRWLKVWAGMNHLISHNKKGITLQFYVAVIACLLMHLSTGRKVNKYTLFLMGQVAMGLASFEQIMPMLDKIEREKEQERKRLQRKRFSKTRQLLPG